MQRVRSWSMESNSLRGHNRTLGDHAKDGSSFDWDFRSGRLPPNTVFSRASTGTFIGPDGVVKTAQINEPRFNYDSLGRARGLLIEQSATNVVNFSESFDTVVSGGAAHAWGDLNITRNSTTNISPANTATALEIQATANNGHLLMTAGLASASRWASVWIKRISGTGTLQFTLNGTAWTSFPAAIQNSSQTWVRWIHNLNTTTTRFGVRLATSGDVIQVWGVQLETGAPSSYIPTGSSTASRSEDLAYIDTAGAPWLDLSKGTLALAGDKLTTANGFLGGLSDANGFGDAIALYQTTASNFRVVTDFGSTPNHALGSASTDTTVFPFACGMTYLRDPIHGERNWNYGVVSQTVGGESTATGDLTTDLGGYVTDDFTQQSMSLLMLGSALHIMIRLRGHVRRVTYWPFAIRCLGASPEILPALRGMIL